MRSEMGLSVVFGDGGGFTRHLRNAMRAGRLEGARRSVAAALALAAGVAVLAGDAVTGGAGSGLEPGKGSELGMKVFNEWFELGAAIPGAGLSEAERRLLFAHFGAVTPENNMKPVSVQPSEGRFTFGPADALLDLAAAAGLAVHGHTLVWHQQCPDWFFLDGDVPAGRELVLERMRTHIGTVAGRYAGRVRSWDVVNEALSDGGGYLRQSPWLKSIGEDFIAEAFFAARQADPGAELYYNDYNIERRAKRAKALRLVRELRQRDVPIDGIGIQGHWQLDRIPFEEIEEALVAFHGEGLKVMITELDIDVVRRGGAGADVAAGEEGGDDPFAEGLTPEVQQRLAAQYAELFALFLRHHDKISRVTFWGLHDGRSWLNTWPRRRTNHPLLWDRELQPKPAFRAVVEQASRKARQAP